MGRALCVIVAALASLTGAAACGDDDPGSLDGGATAGTVTGSQASGSGQVADGTTTATTEPAEPCTCRLEDVEAVGCGFEAVPQWTPGCPEAMPCDRVTVECMRPGQDLYSCMDQELVYAEAALQCALEALRDQTPVRLEIDGLEDMGVFSGQSLYVVHVLGEGTAVSAGCQSTDTEFFYELGPSAHQVMDAAYFEGCLALATAAERYDCLWAGLPVTDELSVCPG